MWVQRSALVWADRVSSGQVDGLWSLLVEELVEETNVGKRAPGHDGVVTSARAVRVEVPRVQPAHTHKLLEGTAAEKTAPLVPLLSTGSTAVHWCPLAPLSVTVTSIC